MEKIDLIVCKKVKERRLALGLSQDDLAKKAKTSLTTINRLEKGRQYPRYETLAEIAKALGLSQSDLFTEAPPIRPSEVTTPDRSGLILSIQDDLKGLNMNQLEDLKDIITHMRNPIELEDEIGSKNSKSK